jgi:hypothetical protein
MSFRHRVKRVKVVRPELFSQDVIGLVPPFTPPKAVGRRLNQQSVYIDLSLKEPKQGAIADVVGRVVWIKKFENRPLTHPNFRFVPLWLGYRTIFYR